MLVFMIVVSVLIGVAYADYCLISNTAHFGICYGKVAEAERARSAGLSREVEETVAPAAEPEAIAEVLPIPAPAAATMAVEEKPVPPPRNPALAWRLPDLEPVLELHEGWQGASR